MTNSPQSQDWPDKDTLKTADEWLQPDGPLPQSQDEALLEILAQYREALEYGPRKGPPETARSEAITALKAWRRTTSLEALPEKVPFGPIDMTAKQNRQPWEKGFNTAIDLTKKNIGGLE